MFSSNKEFEKHLLDAGEKLLDPPSSVEGLLAALDKADYYLSRVEQCPNKSIKDAISPCTKALVVDKLFRHSDTDVMVAVASCISEITRITAPEAPYTYGQMKEAFGLIVSSFEHLDDNSSQSFAKRISILETLAKVRSCVLMLDLECNTLILEMFQHFFKTIRDFHSEKVFSYMETIMTLVIEESEDISSELLSPFLDTLKRDNEGILPIAKRLGEKVFENCATKLKPYLGRTLRSFGTTVDDYSGVFNMCVFHKDGGAPNNINEAPAGEPEAEPEVASPKSEVSNGQKLATENEILTDAVSVEQPEIAPRRPGIKTSVFLGKDKLGTSDSEKETSTPDNSAKYSRKRIKKLSSAKKSSTLVSVTAVDDEKDPGKSLNDGKDPSGDLPSSPQENQFSEDLPSAHPPKETANGNLDVSSPSKSDETKKKEEPSKEAAEPTDLLLKESSKVGKLFSGGASDEDRTPIKLKTSRKQTETTVSTKTNSDKPSTEKVKACNHEDPSHKSLKSKSKEEPVKAPKVHENDTEMPPEKVADQEAGLPFKSTRKLHRDEDQPVVTSKDERLRKRTPAIELYMHKKRHTVQVASESKNYVEELVGSKVKVWWPMDKEYYEGVVVSFDPKTKKHRILYYDGAQELLNLKRERWKIIRDISRANEEKIAAEKIREFSPEIPLRKLQEMRSNKKLSSKIDQVTSSKKSKVVSASPDHKPLQDSKNADTLKAESCGKAKDWNTPNIGSKLVRPARLTTCKSKVSSNNEKESVETEKANLKTAQSTTVKDRTPRNVGNSKKAMASDVDEVKSSSSKTKSKEHKDTLRNPEGEFSDVRKSIASKPKSEDIKLCKDSVDRPSGKVKSGLKEKETKDVGGDSGEDLIARVKTLSTVKQKAKLKPKVKEGEEMVVASGQDSSKLDGKRKLKEREDVNMGTEEDNYVKLKAATSKKQKLKFKGSQELVKESEEPSKNMKSGSMKSKEAMLNVSMKVDDDSGEDTSDKVKTNLSYVKVNPKLGDHEAKPHSREEISDKLVADSYQSKRTPKPEMVKEVKPESGEGPSDQKAISTKLERSAKEKEAVVKLDSEKTADDTATKKKKPRVKPLARRHKTGEKRRREV